MTRRHPDQGHERSTALLRALQGALNTSARTMHLRGMDQNPRTGALTPRFGAPAPHYAAAAQAHFSDPNGHPGALLDLLAPLLPYTPLPARSLEDWLLEHPEQVSEPAFSDDSLLNPALPRPARWATSSSSPSACCCGPREGRSSDSGRMTKKTKAPRPHPHQETTHADPPARNP